MSRTAVSSVLVPSSGLVHRSSLQSKPFPGQTTGMAAERAEDAALSEEQLDAAVGQLEEGNAGPAMRATLAAVSGKVTTQSNGKVTMRAESQDTLMWVWGVVRLVSASPKTEAAGNVDGWLLPHKDIDSGELFCAFGTGAEHKCLVSFQAPHRGAQHGKRGKTRAVGALQEGSFDARGGTHVAFKDGMRNSILDSKK